MSRVWGHLSPTMPGQEPVNHRGFNRLAKLLRQVSAAV
jgi:hypothetical protein